MQICKKILKNCSLDLCEVAEGMKKAYFAGLDKNHLYPAAACVLLISLCITVLSSAVLPSATADSAELMKLLVENEDPLVSANDLAYFLVIHDYDARPKDDYVEVRLNATAVYKLVPNGSFPGLANMTMMDTSAPI